MLVNEKSERNSRNYSTCHSITKIKYLGINLPKLYSENYISHDSKVMLKILQARLQQYMNHELQMFKLVLGKAEEPEVLLPTSTGSLKKQESSGKTSISALLTMPKPLTVWITINCGEF